jgi:hypothetical protein
MMKSIWFKIVLMISILTDRRYIPFFIQRRFMRVETRLRVASWIAARRPTKAFANALSPTSSALLGENGISHLGKILNDVQVAEARTYLEHCLIKDPYNLQLAAFRPMAIDRDASVHVAFHGPLDVITAPHLLKLANRPELLAIAEEFLGCKPTIGYMAAWWSFATNEPALAAEKFHRDVDDWRFLKLFVYLTDVGDKQGPHIYVQASADTEQLLDIRRYEDAEVISAFGNNAILTNTGNAGEAFFENTFGIHKGQPVEAGRRLLFQVVYSLVPLPYGPRRPILALSEGNAVTGAELDPFINRVYLNKLK